MKKLFLILSVCFVILSFSGCTKKTEETDKSAYDLGGRTYYNTVNEYRQKDHAKVWFGKDGSFVFTEADGKTYEISGSYKIDENVCTLSADSGDVKKILFEIKDEDTLVLKTSLSGSKTDQIFSTAEIKDADPLPETKTEEIDITGTYYNSAQPGNSKSFLVINKDGSIEFVDIQGMGAIQITGTYEREEELIGILNFEPKDAFGESVDSIFFIVEEKGKLTLDTDIGGSKQGDVFLFGELLPTEDDLSFRRYKNMMHPDIREAYIPSIELLEDGNFVFTENCYSGMGQYNGWYEKKDDMYICHVTDASSMKGYAGQDVTQIEFTIKDEKSIVLKTDLCMSLGGDVFDLVR